MKVSTGLISSVHSFLTFHNREAQQVGPEMYPGSVQFYNAVILFFHFLGPAATNLFSAVLIIIGTVRQRAAIQQGQARREQFRRQGLLIGPVIHVLLSNLGL